MLKFIHPPASGKNHIALVLIFCLGILFTNCVKGTLLAFPSETTKFKQTILKVARAPSRELVALLEGTDEALDGLEGLGEVVIDIE